MISFHTENLNQGLYRGMIYNVLLHLKQSPNVFVKEWQIDLYSLEATETDFFNHVKTTSGQKINPNMPSGVTGQYEMKLFLHDPTNELKDRENSDRVQHELCHARLFEKFGTADGMWVKLVHEEPNRFPISFWYQMNTDWREFQMTVIDIRCHI